MMYLNAEKTEMLLPKNTLYVISVVRIFQKNIKEQLTVVDYEFFMQIPRVERKNYCSFSPAEAKLHFHPSLKKRRFEISIAIVEHL